MLWLKEIHTGLPTYKLCKMEFNSFLSISLKYTKQMAFKIPLPMWEAHVDHLIHYGNTLLLHTYYM